MGNSKPVEVSSAFPEMIRSLGSTSLSDSVVWSHEAFHFC